MQTVKKPKSALLPMYLIAPGKMQPRKYFDEKRLDNLKQSIEKYGLIHPVTVKSIGKGEFELIAGERRFRACELLGMEEIPAFIVNAEERMSALMSLSENMSREPLIFTEKANCINELIDTYKYSRDELSNELGVGLADISLYRKYAQLPVLAKRLIREYELSERHVAAALKLNDPDKILEALQKICLNGLDAKQSAQMVKAMKENRKQRIRRIKNMPADERFFKNTIRRALDIVRKGGIDADFSETETEAGTEIRINIFTGKNDKIMNKNAEYVE